jgi:hypothetical protein
MTLSHHILFPPPRAGEVLSERFASEAEGANAIPPSGSALKRLATSPVNGGGKAAP